MSVLLRSDALRHDGRDRSRHHLIMISREDRKREKKTSFSIACERAVRLPREERGERGGQLSRS